MRQNRHVVIFLLSLALVIAQCIVELIFVSFLITISPDIGTFLYSEKLVFVILHIIITIVLLWYAGRCGDRYCAKRRTTH